MPGVRDVRMETATRLIGILGLRGLVACAMELIDAGMSEVDAIATMRDLEQRAIVSGGLYGDAYVPWAMEIRDALRDEEARKTTSKAG